MTFAKVRPRRVARTQTWRSSSVARITSLAVGWVGSTTASGDVAVIGGSAPTTRPLLVAAAMQLKLPAELNISLLRLDASEE
jgi:hypothetical protein